MDAPKARKGFGSKILWIRVLEGADDIFQVLVALALLITAALVFWDLMVKLLGGVARGEQILQLAYQLIHDALLVLIILELVWTAVGYLRSRTLPLEPFLIVAVIASVRRLLFLGVQTVEGEIQVMMLWDIAIHTMMVLIFALALYAVRKSRKFLSFPPGPETSKGGRTS